jgi:LacI family transcriptional regulator
LSTELTIPRQQSGNSYRDIENDLAARVSRGAWVQGAKIPPRTQLAREYGVAVATIERAVANLLRKGVLTANKTGTFVASSEVVERPITETTVSGFGGRAQVIRSPYGFASGSRGREHATTTAVIGVVADIRTRVADIRSHNHIVNAILDSLEAEVSAAGGTTRLINLYHDNSREHRSASAILEDIEAANVDAVVAYCNNEAGLERYLVDRSLQNATLTLVSWKSDVRVPANVYYDSVDAGYKAANHLIARGSKRIAFVSPYETEWGTARLAGIRRAVAGSDGQVMLDEYVIPVDGSELLAASDHNHYVLAEPHIDLLIAEGVEFDGVIAVNDEVAHAMMDVLSRHGKVAGKDYRIIGFDDMPGSRQRGLSTLRPPLEEMGAQAAQLSYHVLSGGAPAGVCLQSRVVARSSTCSTHNLD